MNSHKCTKECPNIVPGPLKWDHCKTIWSTCGRALVPSNDLNHSHKQLGGSSLGLLLFLSHLYSQSYLLASHLVDQAQKNVQNSPLPAGELISRCPTVPKVQLNASSRHQSWFLAMKIGNRINCQCQWHFRSRPCPSQVCGPFSARRKMNRDRIREQCHMDIPHPIGMTQTFLNSCLIGRVSSLSRHWLMVSNPLDRTKDKVTPARPEQTLEQAQELEPDHNVSLAGQSSLNFIFQPTRKPHWRLPLEEFPLLNCL